MAYRCFLLTGLACMMNIPGSHNMGTQLQGSQFPWSVDGRNGPVTYATRTNPRVGDRSTTIPEAPTGVKHTGGEKHSGHSWSSSRKRAYRRAKRRAEAQGGTWYRGTWHNAVTISCWKSSRGYCESATPLSYAAQITDHHIQCWWLHVWDVRGVQGLAGE